MPLIVKSRRAQLATIEAAYPGALVLDVTSRSPEPWRRFSPFFPHGGIPVPFSPEHHSMSVEGIWQALKVFEHADVDPSKLRITNMKGIKRTIRGFGRVLGHREGLTGTRLLSYVAARRRIYLPSYRWVLEHALGELVGELAQRAARDPVVLLDYETNEDVSDVARPLSHAALIASYVARTWPD